MGNESRFTEDVWNSWLEPIQAVRMLMDAGLDDREHAVNWLKARLRNGDLRAGGWHIELHDEETDKPNFVIGRYKVTTWSRVAAIPWKDDFWISGDYQPDGDDGIAQGIRFVPREVERESFPHDVIQVRLDPAPIVAFCARASAGAQVAPLQSTTPAVSRRGAKRKDWWDHLWIEMIRRISAGTLKPKSQAALLTLLEDHVREELQSDVGDSTLKPMAANLFKYLKEISGEIGENSNP